VLLDHGADLNASAPNGFTAMTAAVQNNKAANAQLLMQQGAVISNAVATVPRQQYLKIAVLRQYTAVVDSLLQSGADVHTVFDLNHTALYYAAVKGNTDMIKLLLQHGANANEIYDGFKYGPAAVAVETGNIEAVTVLINACDEDSRALAAHNALKEARSRNNTDLIRSLLNGVATVTATGDTALHLAARHGYSAREVCLLIKAPAKINTVNRAEHTPQQVAEISGHTLLATLLTRVAQDM
jgi:ankyrin repeat protein